MPPREPFPDDEALHAELMEQFSIGLEFCFVARVQGYNAESQTFDAIPLVRARIPQADGTYEYEALPVVPSVAMLHQRSRDAFLSLPVRDGDTVLCVVLDADHSAWRRGPSDDVVSPRDLRLHHITNAVAVCHFPRYSRALREASVRAADVDGDSGIVMGYDAADGTRLLMKPDNAVEVVHGTASVFRIEPGAPPASPDFVALAAKVNQAFADLRAAFDAWTVAPNDGGAALKTALTSWTPASVAGAKVKAT